MFLHCSALNVSIGVDFTGDALQPSNYRPGSSLQLTCRVEGVTGYLRYRWTTTCTSSYCFVNNWYTSSSVSENILSYVDAGNHTCTVTDGVGNTGTSNATVNIKGRGVIFLGKIMIQNREIAHGMATYYLKCIIFVI